MQIYKYYTQNKELVEYTSDNVLADEPCYVLGCGMFYPLRVEEYIKFLNKYSTYFVLSEEGLEQMLPALKQHKTFLDKVITYNSLMVMQKLKIEDPSDSKIFNRIISDLEEAFSLVTKKQIKYNMENSCFCDDKNKVSINNRNFSDVRKVIAMQNLIKEPIIYEDQEYAELMAEARRQKNKRNGGNINLSEMISYAKNYGRTTYENIYKQNILQLYADNFCMGQLESYRTMMNFKLVSDKVPDTNLVQAFIDDLYKPNDDSDLLRDTDGFDGKSL